MWLQGRDIQEGRPFLRRLGSRPTAWQQLRPLRKPLLPDGFEGKSLCGLAGLMAAVFLLSFCIAGLGDQRAVGCLVWCQASSRRTADPKPAKLFLINDLGAVAKWLRQRIANPPPWVRLPPAPLLFPWNGRRKRFASRRFFALTVPRRGRDRRRCTARRRSACNARRSRCGRNADPPRPCR